MPFKQGISGNPEGRPRGAINKITKQVREQVEQIVCKHFDSKQLAKDLQAMKPKERVDAFLRLLEYIIPKQRATELRMDFELLSDEDLDRIIRELTNMANGQTEKN